MKKIEIKLKECCLSCEHFDPSGIQGVSPYSTICCGEPDRVIACGHMAVCQKYNEAKDEDDSGWIVNDFTPQPDLDIPGSFVVLKDIKYECKKCGRIVREKTKYCPHCGRRNAKYET